MTGLVRPQKQFALEPRELLHVQAVLFHQIETADKLARKLVIPELSEVLADIAMEARQVFQRES